MLRKGIMLIAILFACSFMLVACSEDAENANGENNNAIEANGENNGENNTDNNEGNSEVDAENNADNEEETDEDEVEEITIETEELESDPGGESLLGKKRE